MTRHSVWNSLPKNVDFSTLTSFKHSIQNISKSPIKILGTRFFRDGRQPEAQIFFSYAYKLHKNQISAKCHPIPATQTYRNNETATKKNVK